MVLFLPLLMLITVGIGALGGNQKYGACFFRKTPRGCRAFMAMITRKQCCQYQGYFVKKPDPGQLFLNAMLNVHSIPNCEDSCKKDHCQWKICGDGEFCISRDNDSICSSECRCTRQQRLSDPVCVLDGPKYRNLCELHLQSCWTNTNQTIVPCQKSGCELKKCGARKCVLTLKGKSECVGRITDCDNATVEPLCGIDNITYLSQCHIKRAGVERGREIYIAYNGICRANAHCSNISCPDSSMSCIKHYRNSSPVCVKCPQSMLDCNRPEYIADELFCLSISRQSQNTCYNDFISCQNNVFTEIIHSGHCLQVAKMPRSDL